MFRGGLGDNNIILGNTVFKADELLTTLMGACRQMTNLVFLPLGSMNGLLEAGMIGKENEGEITTVVSDVQYRA